MKNQINFGMARGHFLAAQRRVATLPSVSGRQMQSPQEKTGMQVCEAQTRAVVVNDSPDLLDDICRFLLLHSLIDVAGMAQDGYEALSEVGLLRPDLVVMDLQMPGMNGLDATEQLRRMFPSLRIIMTSADDGAELASLCRDYGADDFVSNDRLKADLLPSIHRIVTKSRGR